MSVSEVVRKAASDYETAASASELYLIPEQHGIQGHVTAEEMVSLYTQRFVPSESPGRVVYDRLLAAPPHSMCPYCGQRIVSTLDHYLPKAHYSPLVVVPMNLIPVCFDCNKAKSDKGPMNAEDQHPHPYVEDFNDARWLQALLHATTPPSLRFCCSPPITWSDTKKSRISHHFHVLRLGSLYSAHAAAELVNLSASLRKIYTVMGIDGVRQHLSEIAFGHEQAQPNSWQTATYCVLRDSDWYCDGGFEI
jgi:hypothetical protein